MVREIAPLFAAIFAAYGQGVITTIAGGPWVFPASANGGPAIDAPLLGIIGVAVDPHGDIFAVDYANKLVVKVSSAGVLTIVAGTPASSTLGDGGPATSASLSGPYGIAEDARGNLYIADSVANRVRKITSDGNISTVAGNGSLFGGSPLGDGGPAIYAYINSPSGVAADVNGNLYITEPGRVRKVDAAGIISTVAGSGRNGFGGDGGPAIGAQLSSFMRAVAADSDGNVYIADGGNCRIRRVDRTGIISTIAGTGQTGQCGDSGDGGPALNAQLLPDGVAVDANGNLYVADSAHSRIRKVTKDGIITTIAQFVGNAVAVDTSGDIYVASGAFVREISATGKTVTIAGSGTAWFYGDGGPAVSAQLRWPDGITVDANGEIYVADSVNDRIRRITTDGVIRTLAGSTSGYSGDNGPAINAQLSYPRGLALDTSGALYIADVNNSRIRKITPDGIIRTIAGNGQPGFSGDGGPATSAQLYYPEGVAFDANTGNLYIADSSNFRIRMVTPDGKISTVAGTGQPGFSGDGGPAAIAQLSSPSAVAVDSAGNLYIVDSTVCYSAKCAGWYDNLSNQRIRKLDTKGIISTVAGNGREGYSGDGGPAINAELCYPEGVAVDAAGNLYIVDAGNFALRRVDPSGKISTIGPGGASVDDYLKAGGAAAVDTAGNLYIAQYFNNIVQKITGPSAPYLAGSSIVNAASLLPGSASAAPGAIVSIFGQNLANGIQLASPPLPPLLLDTTVTVGGVSAPLLFVSPGQINAQIPFEVLPGTVSITVSRKTGTASSSLTVSAVSPGIFTLGNGQGAILTSTAELAAPAGTVAGLRARPARRGEYISIFLTGLGDVTNRPQTGIAASAQPPYSTTIQQPAVTIGGAHSTPVFSGLAPLFAGVYQVNVQVPDTAATGDAVQVTVGAGTVVSNSVTMAVQ